MCNLFTLQSSSCILDATVFAHFLEAKCPSGLSTLLMCCLLTLQFSYSRFTLQCSYSLFTLQRSCTLLAIQSRKFVGNWRYQRQSNEAFFFKNIYLNARIKLKHRAFHQSKQNCMWQMMPREIWHFRFRIRIRIYLSGKSTHIIWFAVHKHSLNTYK